MSAATRNLKLLASEARTATTNTGDITNEAHRGVHVVIDATAAAATPSVVFTIQGKDELSGQYYTILASAAVTAISTAVMRVFPGATAAANTVANDCLPRTWRVLATAADADSITYSIGASYLV
jgi:predicted polyphosphate/ATP-dependent NAD kinase